MSSDYPMFEQRTKDVIIRVEPEFLAEQSSPAESRYIWAYTVEIDNQGVTCLLYTSPSPRDRQKSRMPSSA